MFYFPAGEHAGRIHNNVQNADISPTILDYLKVPVPEWMVGQSLLKGEPPQNRLIFSATAGEVDPEKYNPPFYQFGTLGVVACDRWYEYYTKRDFLVTGLVKDHTTPCSPDEEITTDAVRVGLLDHLKASKFNVTALPENIYETLPYGKITRAQSSRFILKTLRGSAYDAPQAEGLFSDVSAADPYAPWIEQMYREGMMEPCSQEQMDFCPDDEFTLDDAARVILRAKNGETYTPSSQDTLLSKTLCSSPASAWVQEIQEQGLLSGCTEDPRNCCPEATMDIRQLSTFLAGVAKTP
jgi:hypothetical protein